MKSLATTVLALAAVLLWPSGTAAGQARTLRQRLARATGLSCSFSVKVTGTWEEATPRAEVMPVAVEVTFTDINTDEGTAEAGSDFGASFIVVRYSNDYLHLMQLHGSGPLYTTTVMARETRDGRLMAVHTRHEYTDVRLPGFTSRPEMYLGDCAVEN